MLVTEKESVFLKTLPMWAMGFAQIRLSKTMLDKSIIDANKSVRDLIYAQKKATEYFIDAAYQILMVMKWQKEEKLYDDEAIKKWDSNVKEIIECFIR